MPPDDGTPKPRMKKRFPTLLATLIWTALYSQHTLADLAEQCMLGVPTYDQPLVTGDPNQLPVRINADKPKQTIRIMPCLLAMLLFSKAIAP